MQTYWSQVLVVGGGATGVGILRDLSLRGIPALLLEQGDLAHGTSSRFHGLLHSGARYAVSDPEAASECARENEILKKIAPNCIVDSGGWFVQTADDDPAYTEKWYKKCVEAGIQVREIPLAEAWQQEPLLSRGIKRVFEVPDAAVDGFKLVWANAKSALRTGGEYKTYHRVERLLREGNRIIGAAGRSTLSGEEFVAWGQLVINASGAWASAVAESAGISLDIIRDKGALLAFNQRLFHRVINRLHKPGNGDIFVPHETITILGTTSEFVQSAVSNEPTLEEVYTLMGIGKSLLPGIEHYRMIRAFAGVRPLYRGGKTANETGEGGEEGREVSRNFALIDHEAEQGITGFLSVVGGKFTTYRLMAEKAADWAAGKIGNAAPCRTDSESLVPEIPESLYQEAFRLLPFGAAEKMLNRLGPEADSVVAEIRRDPRKSQMLCECEMISLAEVEKVVVNPDVHSLSDVRRQTRLGMGTCQGAFCSYRALPLLGAATGKYAPLKEELMDFLNRRWKGIRPVLWGHQLRETELARAIYAGLLNLQDSQE